MGVETLMEKSSAYLISERLRQQHIMPDHSQRTRPAITISHEVGSGAPEIARGVARALQKTEEPRSGSWEVFDQELVERALQRQHWPKKLAETITEEKRFFIDELTYDWFNLRPASWVLMPLLIETTMNLAMTGRVILVGHGGTIVTANLPNVFHVRLTGSLPRRIERVQRVRTLTREDAAKFVKTEDHKREKYLKAHFHARMDNELLYDISINTDRISEADAVTGIVEGAQRFFASL